MANVQTAPLLVFLLMHSACALHADGYDRPPLREVTLVALGFLHFHHSLDFPWVRGKTIEGSYITKQAGGQTHITHSDY